MDIRSVTLALDGLDEGFRFVAFELNSVFAVRCNKLQVPNVKKKASDTLSSARSKMRASLPKIMTIDPLRFDVCQPWTLGYVNGLTNHPINIALISLYDDEVTGTIDFLRRQVDWTENQWRKWILEPVAQHNLFWKSTLLELLPKVIGYSAGEDGLRRDAKIAELADAGWTNEQIAAEIERLSPIEAWDAVNKGHIRKRLKDFYKFQNETKPVRTGGRPRKQS